MISEIPGKLSCSKVSPPVSFSDASKLKAETPFFDLVSVRIQMQTSLVIYAL